MKYVYLSTSIPGASHSPTWRMWELRLTGWFRSVQREMAGTMVATELYLITSSLPVPQSTSTCSRSP